MVPSRRFLYALTACLTLTSRRRPRRAIRRHDLATLVLKVAIVLVLLVAEPLGARSWFAGGHVTPEQFARHMLLVGLGVADHHAPAGSSDMNSNMPTYWSRTLVSLVTAPISASGLVPNGFLAVPPSADNISLLVVLGMIVACGSALPGRVSPRPPYPPPRLLLRFDGLNETRAEGPLHPS